MRATIALFMMSVLVPAAAAAQSPAATLAPTGVLRAVFLGNNVVQARKDPQTGAFTGPVPDLANELARTLGVPCTIVGLPDAAAIVAALNSHTADIGFLAYDEARARELDFGAPFMVMLNSYLVRTDSPIRGNVDVDRAGVTVAGVKGQTQETFVSSHLKNAAVRVLPSMPAPTEMQRLLTSREVDVFAINRQRSLDMAAASAGQLRALPDSFLAVQQSFVVAKGDNAKLAPIARFVAGVLESGFMKSSIERAQIAGVDVAAPEK